MNDKGSNGRAELFREALIFQLKLAADGLRDLFLIPVSLIAAVAGLLRGGDQPDREFRQVLEVGRQSERWINLFGNHETEAGENPSLDDLLERAERVVREQAREGGITEGASHAIGRAIDAAQKAASAAEKARGKNTGETGKKA